MKKKMFSWGLYGLAIATMFTSCVSKKKYVEAQNTINDLRSQNAMCMQRGDSLSSNLSMLQQNNSDLQRRYDSTSSAYASSQSRWNQYSGWYDKQQSTAEQMHQQLHEQLDDMVGANNIAVAGSKVYVTLPEASLFSSSNTSLSSKGRDIINTLAATIAKYPNVEVNVATSPVYGEDGTMSNASSWNNSNSANKNWNNANSANKNMMNENRNSTSDSNRNYNNSITNSGSPTTNSGTINSGNTYNWKNEGNATPNRKANVSKTSGMKSNYKSSTKKPATTKYRSETTRRTMKYNSSTRRSGGMNSSTSLAISRASAIVSALRDQGVNKAGIQINDAKDQKIFSRKYQVIVTPSMDDYYRMMDKDTHGNKMK